MRIIGKDSYIPEYKTRTYRGIKVKRDGNRDGYSNLRQIKAGIKIIGQKE